ncbi:phage tail protein [Campylobacterota bacterium DY0563]
MYSYIGAIWQTGFNFSVRDWTLCFGQLGDISQDQVLFALIGTYYGGDGRVSFGFPDLRGRVPIGFGSAPGLSYNYQIGWRAGWERMSIGIQHMPQHTHTHTYNGESGSTGITIVTEISATKQDATQSAPEDGAYLATSKEVGQGGADYIYVPSSDVVDIEKVNLSGASSIPIENNSFDNNSFDIAITGSGTTFETVQPFQVTNFQICRDGLFPSRN